MKWYLLITVFYISFWVFLGWGIDASVLGLVASLLLLLICILVTIFNFENTHVKKALCLLYLPSAFFYGIAKHYDSMTTWRIVFIALGALTQGILLFFYFREKRKK